MRRDETMTSTGERPWSGARRMTTALALLALTAGTGSLPGPARADEEMPPAPARARAAPDLAPVCVEDNMDGVIAFRPAAALRRAGVDRLPEWMASALEQDLGTIAGQLQIDTTRPGLPKLDARNIEWAACGIDVDLDKLEKTGKATLNLGGVTIRMVAPFDWLALLRQWQLECTEVREGDRVFHRIDGIQGVDPADLKPGFKGACYVYLPDDRTIMLASETAIRAAMVPRSRPPAFPEGPDWERAGRGLLAVALSDRHGKFTKRSNPGQPDDSVVPSLVRDVTRWTLWLDDDADAITLHASARCRDDESAAVIARAVEAARSTGRAALDREDDARPPFDGTMDARVRRLAEAFLKNLRVRQDGAAVLVAVEGIGTFADVAAILADIGKSRDGIRDLNKRVADLDARMNGPEVQADRARYHREMLQYVKDLKKYIAELEEFLSGKGKKREPIPPVPPVPSF